MNGARVSYIDSGQIMAVQNNLAGNTTASWYVIFSGNKSITYWAQDNWSNNLYYGPSATSAISYRCL